MEDASASLTLDRMHRTKLAEQVAQQLLNEIRARKLERGTKFPSERELTAQLGVGRSTVREAINGLAMLGVLEQRHGQGVFVLDPNAGLGLASLSAALSRGVTRDLFEARRLVEVEAARLAAVRRTEVDLKAIAEALHDHERALARDAVAAEPSARFHMKIATATHNEILAGFIESFSGELAARGHILEQLPGFREWEVEQHRSVYEPILAGDKQGAGDAMLRHLDSVIKHHERIGSFADTAPLAGA